MADAVDVEAVEIIKPARTSDDTATSKERHGLTSEKTKEGPEEEVAVARTAHQADSAGDQGRSMGVDEAQAKQAKEIATRSRR